jgi:hypothetical protein
MLSSHDREKAPLSERSERLPVIPDHFTSGLSVGDRLALFIMTVI